MLREIPGAGFTRRLTLLGWRYAPAWRGAPAASWSARAFRRLQDEAPAVLGRDGRRTFWLAGDRVWAEDDGLAADDVAALLHERELRRRRRLERAYAGLAGDRPPGRRSAIPRALRLAVWERDGGACQECGATADLQLDHVIPVALGGATSLENLQVLCAPCNQRKGASP